jgi:hypothetical protein
LRKGEQDDADGKTLAAYAKAANVSLEWLSAGRGDPRPGVPESAPTPSRDWAPEHVEEWVAAALQKHPEERYTGRQIQAAKTFLRDMTPLLPADADRVAFSVVALRKVRDLDEDGKALDPGSIFYFGFRNGEPTRADRKGDEELRKHGIEPPGWRGAKKKPSENTPKPPSSAPKSSSRRR